MSPPGVLRSGLGEGGGDKSTTQDEITEDEDEEDEMPALVMMTGNDETPPPVSPPTSDNCASQFKCSHVGLGVTLFPWLFCDLRSTERAQVWAASSDFRQNMDTDAWLRFLLPRFERQSQYYSVLGG
jgi:hypothetical protein